MAPLLALLSILLGGEAEASTVPASKSPVAIVDVAQTDDFNEFEDSWKYVWAHDTQVADIQPAEPTVQRWLGKVEIPGQVIDFVVTIVETEEGLTGKLDIPVQGLVGGELRGVKREGDELAFHFEIPSAPEANWPKWVVTIDETGKLAEGVLNQSGASFPSSLVLDETGKAEVLNRPQNPTRPLPYREEEVTITSGDHTLAGTLTVPDENEFGKGPYPGAVLITGSGPQDRDETLLGHKPFLVLSDRLTRRGIAVLRYDDRGFGGSTGDFATATTMDFADDARACATWLGGRDEVNHIGLIGHSEGGLIAPFVARDNDGVDFVVLLAAPGVPGREVIMRQMHDLSVVGGLDEATIAEQSKLMKQVYDMIDSGASEEEIRSGIDKLVRLQFGVAPDDESGSIAEAVEQTYQQVTGPWWSQFLKLDPRPALREMTQPVLALNGSLDLQVAADQNLAEIERVFADAGKSDKLTAFELDGLNHLFQPATTGGMDEYSQIETTFDEDAMERIARWIIEHVR